jgi:hypothetical protein
VNSLGRCTYDHLVMIKVVISWLVDFKPSHRGRGEASLSSEVSTSKGLLARSYVDVIITVSRY